MCYNINVNNNKFTPKEKAVKITIDTLSTMSDDDLYNMGRRIKSKISGLLRDFKKLSERDVDFLHLLQTDSCYVQREMTIRKDRQSAHFQWLENQR